MTFIAFTGHRPDKLAILGEDGLRKIEAGIDIELLNLRASRVISGMAPGIDVIALRRAHRMQIPCTASIPWIGHPFSGNWDFGRKVDEYLSLLDMCDRHHICCEGEQYRPWFYQKRNEWMVDNCDILLAVWDGTDGGTRNCIKYARKVGRKILYYNWKTGGFGEQPVFL